MFINKYASPTGKLKITVVLLLFLSHLICDAQSVSYYVDSQNGSDQHSGRSIAKAWKTLRKLNTITFQKGDNIFLKRGQIFEGYLYLKGRGTAFHKIRLCAYGIGRRPIIQSKGYNYSVQMLNAQYWEITDIETTGGDRAGIFIGCTKDGLILNHIRVINCYVHNIGDTSKIDFDYSKSTGGIIVVNGTFDSAGKPVFYNSVLNDVIINDCTVRYNHRWTCISISSGKINDKRGNANYIKNCLAEYSSADGIRMNGVQNSFIEYCVMYRNGAWPNFPGKNLGGLGAWFFDAENCTIQFCEASHVQAATTDGGAFDIDYWQKNSTVQYCYGHDCSGYGVSVFGADSSFPTENSVVRYNVFSNNGRDPAFAFEGDFFVFTWNGGLLNGVKVHNNTSYWNPVADSAAIRIEADFTGSNPNLFTNNTVYSKREKLMYLKNDSMQCDNNNYYTDTGIAPQWQFKNENIRSFAEWQQKTGQEIHSRVNDTIPTEATTQSKTNTSPPLSCFLDKRIKRGMITMVSFIDLDDPGINQAQLVFIKSMENQYARYGLNIILIGEFGIGKNNSQNINMTNFISDQELTDFVLIRDDAKHHIAYKCSIDKFPATFLLAKDGREIRSWDALAQPADLAKAIEHELRDKLTVKHFDN